MVGFGIRPQPDEGLLFASLSGELSPTRRALAGLLAASGKRPARGAVARVLTVLEEIGVDGEAINELAELLDDGRAGLERAIYFALAGRGIGLAVSHLRWFASLLGVQGLPDWRKAGQTCANVPDLRVDLTKLHFGPSLAFRTLHEAPVAALDKHLERLSLDPCSPALLRVLSCLSIGVHPVFAREAAEELCHAIEQYGETGRYSGSRLGAILSHEGCDYQRALYFSAVSFSIPGPESGEGRTGSHADRAVLVAFERLVAALTRRQARFEDTANAGGFPLVSPYLCGDRPESCVFRSHAGQEFLRCRTSSLS